MKHFLNYFTANIDHVAILNPFNIRVAKPEYPRASEFMGTWAETRLITRSLQLYSVEFSPTVFLWPIEISFDIILFRFTVAKLDTSSSAK